MYNYDFSKILTKKMWHDNKLKWIDKNHITIPHGLNNHKFVDFCKNKCITINDDLSWKPQMWIFISTI